MEENTFRGKEKALTDEEKARYARRFVSRYINGELTGKEKAIVEGLQADAKEHELTDEELERRVIRGFDRLAGTLGMEKLTSAEERRLARRFPARHSPARHSPARSFLTKRSPARHRAGGLTRPPRIAVAWREGALLFDDASPRELKLKIEARYGATVTVIDNAIPLDSRLKASFPADARLEQVSRQVAEMYGISYRIEGQHVIFE